MSVPSVAAAGGAGFPSEGAGLHGPPHRGRPRRGPQQGEGGPTGQPSEGTGTRTGADQTGPRGDTVQKPGKWLSKKCWLFEMLAFC